MSAPKRPRYRIIDLGLPPKCTSVIGVSWNERGGAVGHLVTHTAPRAFHWKNGKFIVFEEILASAVGVNASGIVVGAVFDKPIERAAIWKQGRVELIFEDYKSSKAVSIDSRGNIYGMQYDTTAKSWRGFVRDTSGRIHLMEIKKGTNHFIKEANERGQVAMNLLQDSRMHTSARFDKGSISILRPLQADDDTFVHGINDNGDIVGYERGKANTPLIWRNGVPSALPAPSGTFGIAYSINTRGDIVGYISGEGSIYHAFLISDGIFYYLEELLDRSVRLAQAVKIDNSGNILATGPVDSHTRTYLLRPIR